ncbi:DUF3147 family protein [Caloranaerobacter sp. DY30410]|uniref:DUF3147 family protein n=1 Tax=Caloranaerobacter sp. DY30410 TaxID=3238305 RepID=UPI003D0597AA
MQFIVKTIVSALIIATVSTLGKKFSTFAAIIASLPLTSMLSIIWLFRDTQDVQKVIDLSISILWVIIPSLIFFIALVYLLKQNIKFHWAMLFSTVIMIISYNIYIFLLRKLGVNI